MQSAGIRRFAGDEFSKFTNYIYYFVPSEKIWKMFNVCDFLQTFVAYLQKSSDSQISTTAVEYHEVYLSEHCWAFEQPQNGFSV